MTILRHASLALLLAAVGTAFAGAASAQEAPKRTRITLGPQLAPTYPGADRVSLRPFVDVSRTRGDAPFVFEAPDESTGFTLLRRGRLGLGPAIGFEGKRTVRDVGAPVPNVGFTVEAGGFVQYDLTDHLRVRGELRQGIGGHKGLIGNIGADYILRRDDAWLVSIGPRLTVANGRYHDAYFSVTPAAAATAGIPAFDAKGGVQAVGATAGFLRQITAHWGVQTYAKYDRLVADPARSPLVRRFGTRDQLSGGVALSYTF